MMKRSIAAVVLAAGSMAMYGQAATGNEKKPAVPAVAQEGRRVKLLFVVRETDDRGKVLNAREYQVLVGPNAHAGDAAASIRTGAKVPVWTAGADQYTYLDVGVNFDIDNVVFEASGLHLRVRADITSLDPQAREPGAKASLTVIRQNRWSGDEEMTFGERKVIFSSDDLTSKNRLQVELLVTKGG